MTLQKLAPFSKREAKLEQYSTPADIAADVLWEAFAAGDIAGRRVVDLGCGPGILAIGAKLLGAQWATGVDIDPLAIGVARENVAATGAEVELIIGDVGSFTGRFDTVLQNPPFGAQTRDADLKFIAKALELAPRAYSLHKADTQEFVARRVGELGGRCEPVKKYKFEIPYAFEFHRKATDAVSVVLLRYQR